MKVNKDPLRISNRKKNALPSSKLLKPKKLKSIKKSGDASKLPLSADKLKLVNDNISAQLNSIDFTIQDKLPKKLKRLKKSNGELQEKTKASLQKVHNKSQKSAGVEESKVQHIPTLFDFVPSPVYKQMLRDRTPMSKEQINEGKEVKLNDKVSKQKKLKEKQGKLNNSSMMKELSNTSQIDKNQKNTKWTTATNIDNYYQLQASKVAGVASGLLKHIEETSSSKQEILDIGEPIYLQVECIKIPICATKQLRFKLPHSLIDETSNVLLVTADLKGHKIYPDRAVDHYEELLAKHQVDFITKVMPMRMVKQEYSQYEMKRKLVNQFDVILADNRIIRSLGVVLGKFALYSRKMPIPVNLTLKEPKLKKHLQDAVRTTQMTVKSNGHASIVQVGHSKMSAKEIGVNTVEITNSLETVYPGGWRNVRSLAIKTSKSTSLPVYFSLLSPNDVKIPIEVPKKPSMIEGELSTMPGHNVIVTSNWNVILKKVEEDIKVEDSKDDEILEEAKKYLESSKTVRYDDSSDEDKADSESDDEGEAITEAMEKKLMNKYEKNAKAKKNKNEEEDEEEEEEVEDEDSEEESKIAPLTTKKRKSEQTKKQNGPSAKKAFKPVELKNEIKINKSNKENKKVASPGIKKQQMRGTRGGKKSKMSKDQRKALIKRKKAGKK